MADDKKCDCGQEAMKDMPLPEVTFSTFLMSLSSSALVALGEIPEPTTGKTEFMPHIAKQTIDILAMIQRKTEQGLDDEEKKLLCDLLYDLRMKYVNKVK